MRGGELLYIAGRTARVLLVRQRGVVHLPDDLGEQFVHHGLAFGRGLHEGAAPLLRQRLALARRHLPLVVQVHLVPHQDHRHSLIPESNTAKAGQGRTGGLMSQAWLPLNNRNT